MTVGFLEDENGDKSSARLTIQEMVAMAGAIVFTMCAVAFRGGSDAVAVIGVMTAPLATILGGIYANLTEKRKSEAAPPA